MNRIGFELSLSHFQIKLFQGHKLLLLQNVTSTTYETGISICVPTTFVVSTKYKYVIGTPVKYSNNISSKLIT